MRQAAAEQAKEGEQIKLYGMRFEPYLPHYYLGLALFQTGDCAAALPEFAISQSQGALGSSESKILAQDQAACLARIPKESPKPSIDMAKVTQAIQTAEADLTKGEEAARAVAALQGDSELAPIWSQDSALGPPQKQAQDLLFSARAKLEAGKKASDIAQVADARELASRAIQQFDKVRGVAIARREEAIRNKLAVIVVSPRPPSALPPPTELVRGAQAYFDGRYPEAIGLLGRPFTGAAAAQATLLRAAARYTLYVVGAEKDAPLRSAAIEDVRACRRVDPGAAPDPRFFSPRFVDFFNTSR
jgi:hypothetical protein